jgi:hypothetical protein
LLIVTTISFEKSNAVICDAKQQWRVDHRKGTSGPQTKQDRRKTFVGMTIRIAQFNVSSSSTTTTTAINTTHHLHRHHHDHPPATTRTPLQ